MAKAAQVPCKQCRKRMTWAGQRVQYGRLIRAGLDKESAQKVMPKCQKCVTKLLRDLDDFGVLMA